MDDERLLSEALRAHAAGGVSTPRAVPPSEPPTAAPATDAPAERSRRFRPLGRRKTADPAPVPTTAGQTVRADVPAPRSGSLAPPPPSGAPLGVRHAPPRPAPPYGGPRPGHVPAHGPYPPVPPPAVTPAQGPGTWNASTVAWWGAVSLLAGGTVGAAIGVLSLLLPA